MGIELKSEWTGSGSSLETQGRALSAIEPHCWKGPSYSESKALPVPGPFLGISAGGLHLVQLYDGRVHCLHFPRRRRQKQLEPLAEMVVLHF